jgi:hypothetical protein
MGARLAHALKSKANPFPLLFALALFPPCSLKAKNSNQCADRARKSKAFPFPLLASLRFLPPSALKFVYFNFFYLL